MYKKTQNTFRAKKSYAGLCYLAAAAAVSGLVCLLPLMGIVTDILLIVAVSMTIMIPLIIGSARQPWEIAGFPQMTGFISLIRLTFLACVIKTAFGMDDWGHVLNSINKILPERNIAVNIILLCGILIFSMVLIQSRLASILRNCKKSLVEIIPAKAKGLENDRQAGFINEAQAKKMQDKINKEAAFYSGSKAIAGVLMLESWVSITAICIAITYSITQLKTQEYVRNEWQNVITAGGLATIIQLCIAWVSEGIINKGSFKLKNIDPEDDKTIKADFAQTMQNVDHHEDFELLNPDFEKVGRCIGKLPEPTETIAMSEHIEFQETQAADNRKHKYGSLDEYYDDLVGLISDDADRQITVMRSDGNMLLPVTVPVNCAIRISQAGQKVLLIDAQISRKAIGEVFELEIAEEESEPMQTCIENIYVANASSKIESAEYAASNIFDKIIVYAPEKSVEIEQESLLCDQMIMFRDTASGLNVADGNSDDKSDIDDISGRQGRVVSFSYPDYENWQ